MKRFIQTMLALTVAAALATAAPQPAPAAAKDGAKAAAKEVKTKAPKAPKVQAAPAPTAAEIADAKAKGMVWANLNTKVFHKDGERYGTTKHGKFMTEADATKAGYRAAKEPAAKKAGKTAKVDKPAGAAKAKK